MIETIIETYQTILFLNETVSVWNRVPDPPIYNLKRFMNSSIAVISFIWNRDKRKPAAVIWQ